ncbi:MAG TPA: ATP-binding protein [Spirochaetota bacterium]|nr:ATP-binding protein [Spirochaetota bacterium]HPI88546.1 ATP-binding protein [Spirochaetota bacterium]HPR48026.1 ATP-binding protein [Spirochaetota bacterium]
MVLVIIFLLLFGTASSEAVNRILTVGLYENSPKVFTDENGKPSGIFIDIIAYTAGKEGWELKYVPGTWDEGLSRLEKGEIDIMPDVAYSAEREKKYSFNKVQVLSSWYQAYARKGSGIHSILDLNGKRIIVLKKSVQQEAFNRFSSGFGLNMDIVSVSDYKTMFEMLSMGEADAGITNQFYGSVHARKYGLADTAIVFAPSSLFFATKRNTNVNLLNAIDRDLAELKKDTGSLYYHSLRKWTSEEIPFSIPSWLKFIVLAAGAGLLLSMGGSFILKHQVNVRTRELKEINAEMEQRIVERTAELAEAMERAQDADRLKSAFLATMSHELRTPLNSIIGFTGIMLQGLAGPLNNEQTRQLSMVQNSASHLLSLINDILDISKIEAGQLETRSEPFDMREAIESSLRTVMPQAEKKGLPLEAVIASDVGMLKSDRRRIEQILINLMGNAVKFTDKGTIRVECRTENGWLVTAVSDTGIGIESREMEKLFLPFRQIDTGLARRHEGTGLGLSICKRLVEMLGGTIGVESEIGKGSTFTFWLPLQLNT